MLQKKMFKVIAHIEKGNGKGGYWMRLGSAFPNKDDSINVYLDAIPVDLKTCALQLREMDEEDFKKKDSAPSRMPPPSLGGSTSNPSAVPF